MRVIPPISPKVIKMRQIAEALRHQPGRWAEYPGTYTRPQMTLYMLERGNDSKQPSFPPTEFEFRVRDGKVHVRCRIFEDMG